MVITAMELRLGPESQTLNKLKLALRERMLLIINLYYFCSTKCFSAPQETKAQLTSYAVQY